MPAAERATVKFQLEDLFMTEEQRKPNLLTEPHELETVLINHTWVTWHVAQIMEQFDASVRREELIPFGAPVDFIPSRPAGTVRSELHA